MKRRGLVAGALATTLAVITTVFVVTRSNPEFSLLDLLNSFRKTHDRHVLALDVELSRCAETHSNAMANAGTIFHTTPAKVNRCLGARAWSLFAENVGVGGSVKSVQDAFRASEEHRVNELRRPLRYAAIGVVVSGGAVWVTLMMWG